MTGYVTKSGPEDDGDTVSLRIPNKEVSTIFQDTVVSLFRDTIDNSKQKSITEGKSTDDLREMAIAEGMIPMKENVRIDVLQGLTSYEEYVEMTISND